MNARLSIHPFKILWGLLLLLALAACAAPPAPEATQTPEPTATVIVPTNTQFVFPTLAPTRTPAPTATRAPTSTPFPTFTTVPSLTPVPTRTPTPGVVGLGMPGGIFRDDFSDTTSGWRVASTGDYSIGYASGGYRIAVFTEGWEAGAARTRQHTNMIVSADVEKLAGPNDAYFGVTCRENARSNYSFAITGGGEWGIYQVTGREVELLAGGASDFIRTSKGAVNHLEGRCIGTTLAFYVNDELVGSVVDVDFPGGAFAGLVVGAVAEGGIEVLFDNFVANPSAR